jgi:hypothetical protein
MKSAANAEVKTGAPDRNMGKSQRRYQAAAPEGMRKPVAVNPQGVHQSGSST